MRRFIALLSLAALVAVAVTAFIAAGSASAAVKKYVLCKALQTLCTSANLWGTHVTVVAHSPLTILLSGIIPVKCLSTMVLLAETDTSTNIKGKVTELSWGSCEVCTTATTTTLPTGELKAVSGDKATLLTTSSTVVLLKGCPFGAECTVLVEEASLEVTGGTIGGTAKIKASEVPVVIDGGVLCGSSGKWDAGAGESASYTVASVNGLASGNIFVSPESHG